MVSRYTVVKDAEQLECATASGFGFIVLDRVTGQRIAAHWSEVAAGEIAEVLDREWREYTAAPEAEPVPPNPAEDAVMAVVAPLQRARDEIRRAEVMVALERAGEHQNVPEPRRVFSREHGLTTSSHYAVYLLGQLDEDIQRLKLRFMSSLSPGEVSILGRKTP